MKVGTTNDLERRQSEHTRNYHRAKDYTLPKDSQFAYDWWLRLSKYNTLRFEDKTRKCWQELEVGEYVRNDRFCCAQKPDEVEITIRKTYRIAL